jgi:hypothetical protein
LGVACVGGKVYDCNIKMIAVAALGGEAIAFLHLERKLMKL